MDTIQVQRPLFDKAAICTAGIILCLLLSQNLIISALHTGSITGISPAFNLESKQYKETIFEQEILKKYKGADIAEIDKGVKHVRLIKYYEGRPVRINIVELSKDVNDRISAEPAIASQTLASKRKISDIAGEKDAIAAINGGFFKPQSGIPLGTLVINKKIYTGSVYDRTAMGIFDKGYDMARVQLKANIETNIGGLKIDNVNQPRMLSTHVLVYTQDWGEISPPSPVYGMQITVEDGKITRISRKSSKIPKNGFVISGPEKDLRMIMNGEKVKLNMQLTPEWKDVNHIISGGPYLVKNGEIYVDMTAQKLGSIGGRNPRTAIGYTKDNHLIMLTADGREGKSAGLTLVELAGLMKELGCINAMNLDGGGSTVMYVKGQIVNRPQVQGGIPLSNTLTVRKVS